jgi:hypothetical protein
MRRVALIAMIAGCSGAPAAQKPVPEPAPAPAETLWDRGTFVTVENEVLVPGVEEAFEIYRTASGYRFAVTWKRPAPTGEPSSGEVTLVTDDHFSPLQGRMVTTLRSPGKSEITRSTIQREPDGRLTTEVIAPDGSKVTAQSTRANDWFIGGSISTFLLPLCATDPSVTSALVFPDNMTTLAAPLQLALDTAQRNVTWRALEYQKSKRRVVAACENGKLAGEVTRGITIVRAGDLELARALDAAFH